MIKLTTSANHWTLDMKIQFPKHEYEYEDEHEIIERARGCLGAP